MVISPNDFSLWSRLTGNKYPSTPKERAQKGPEVQRFIQNLGREGMLGGKENKKEKEDSNLGKKIAKGALIAGGTAATIAAARDPRVQETIKKAASATRNKIDDFLVNLGRAQDVDVDIVDASGDVTPDPSVQQSNVAPQQDLREPTVIDAEQVLNDARKIVNRETSIDVTPETTQKSLPESPSLIERVEQKKAELKNSFKPAVGGKTFQTSGAVGSEDVYGDIGDAKLRARRTFGPTIDAIKEMNPDQNVSRMGRQMLNQAQKDRDFDISYITARNSGMSDADAVQVARETAGFNPDAPVGKPTQYRNLLGTLKTSSPLKPRVDDLINLVQTGQKVKLPEGAQEPGALVQISANNATPDNKAIKVGAEIGGSTLTDQQATKMAVDNVLDEAKQRVTKLPRSGPTEGQTQDEFIEDQFSTNPADPKPEISGTVMPKNGESYRPTIGPVSDTMAARLGDIRLKNQQDLMSGNVSPEQAAALGGRLKSGLIYKNSPELLQRDSEILTAAMVGEGAFKFGPEFTKMKQNLQLGADFPEILQDPSKETVSIAGEQLPRTDLEKPAAFGPTAERLDERKLQQKDFRGKVRLEATSDIRAAESNMKDIEKRGKALKSLEGTLTADGNTAGAERVKDELQKLRNQYRFQKQEIERSEKRIEGITEKTEANIANLAVPKTLKNPYGAGYKVEVGANKETGEMEAKAIVPDFERKIETKREIDTGGFDIPEVVETGKKGGFSLQQPGVGRKVIGTKTSKQGIQYPVLSNEIATGDMTAGSKPTGIAGQIQDIYRSGDPTTIKQRVKELTERIENRKMLGLPTDTRQSPFFYQNGD
tara:strand:+ start:87 stop:2564 length:2478 start_codon:yes stop_codon:yes gene_type:complete